MFERIGKMTGDRISVLEVADSFGVKSKTKFVGCDLYFDLFTSFMRDVMAQKSGGRIINSDMMPYIEAFSSKVTLASVLGIIERTAKTRSQLNKSMNYETAIKKISEQLHKKSNPEPEMQKYLEEQEKAGKQTDPQEQEESIFEQPGVTTRNHADKSIQQNKVNIGGKELDLHVRLDENVEKTIVRLAHEGKANEAHDVMRGYIYEMLQPQLSSRDLELANKPTDFQIKKQAFGSAGTELVTQVRNKSLIDALACAHICLISIKHQFIKAALAEEHQKKHNREEIGEMIAGIPSEVEGELCPVCDHLENVYGAGISELQAPTSIYDNINNHDELDSFAKKSTSSSEHSNSTSNLSNTTKNVVGDLLEAQMEELEAQMAKRPY